MSMPIQRQSESFGYFDDGPRHARDRSPADLPKGLAGLVNGMGPRIQAGMLDTRSAGYGRSFSMGDSPFSPGWGPRDHGGRGPDGGPLHPPSYYDEDSPEDDDEEYFDPDHDPDRFIPESDVDPRTAAAAPDLRARYAAHFGSRHPFDRTAACQACGGDVLPDGGDWSHVDAYLDGDHEAEPGADDFDNDEYGQGRDPAAAHDEYEHRMLNEARLAAWADDNPDYDDVMRHIDEQLSAGEPEMKRNGDGDWELEPPRRPAHEMDAMADQMMDRVNQMKRDGKIPRDLDDFAHLHDYIDANVGWGEDIDENLHSDDYIRLQDVVHRRLRQTGRDFTAAENVVDPAAQQQMVVPAAGGYQPGHRVGLPWRDQVVRGTVIGLDGDAAAIRWDDGQYSSEEPHNIQLL